MHVDAPNPVRMRPWRRAIPTLPDIALARPPQGVHRQRAGWQGQCAACLLIRTGFVVGKSFFSIEPAKTGQVTSFSWRHFTHLLPFAQVQLKAVQVMGIHQHKTPHAH